MAGGSGTLQLVVWPSYVGVSCGAPNDGLHFEPTTMAGYDRGQISWGLEDGQIVGRALIHAPADLTYSHLVYFTHPTEPTSVGNRQLPHPITFTTAGVIEVYPITNEDLAMNKRQGIDYQ
jgi:hypothetical protein